MLASILFCITTDWITDHVAISSGIIVVSTTLMDPAKDAAASHLALMY